MLDRDNNKGRKSSITPVMDDFIARIEDNDTMIMEERGNYAPLRRRVQQAAATAWAGENVAIAITDLLGPYARKEWNLPVGSHRNPFWRITRRFSSPRKVKEVLNKSLVLCCTLGSPALVKNLLEAGAEPNGESGKWGPLHSAAYGGNSEIMRVLLEDPRTYPDSVEEKGKTASHLAAKKGNFEVLKMLLETTKVNINAADDCGCTPLHVAGASPLLGEVPTERYLKCISLLMSRPDLKLNMPCKGGSTALAHSLMFSRKEVTEVMLKHNNGHSFNIDTFLSGEYGKTIREAISSTFPELIAELSSPLQEKIDSPVVAISLLASLQKGDLCMFQSLLKCQQHSFSINHWYDEPYYCTLLEIACQLKKRVKFIAVLLNAGANPNTINKITMQSVLHLTVKRGNVDGLKELLKAKDINVNIKDAYDRTPLHYLSSIHPTNKADSELLQQSISLLLGEPEPMADGRTISRPKIDINAINSEGETPLHIAARMGETETLFKLLRNGANIMNKTAGLQPPITFIDPSIMESYLDECIETNEHSPIHEDFMLIFDYSFLHHSPQEETYCKDKNTQAYDPEMPTIKFFSKTQRYNRLLKHPVITSFLQLKWKKVRTLYLINLALYFIFLGLLTWHTLQSDERNSEEMTHVQKISLSLLSISLLIIILCELYQFFTCPTIYMHHFRNYMLWCVIMSTLNVCVDNVVTIVPQCTSVAVMLAWTHLIILLGCFPSLSIQLEMLKTVAFTFFKFIIGYSPLFFAFGICFYIMFRYSGSEEDEFFSVSFGMSLLKIFIMFAGEFEASDIPFETAPYTSHIVFTIFVFIISVVLYNLLNGLAVSDAQAIRRDAEVLSLAARVMLIYYLEKMSSNRTTYCSVLKRMPDMKFRTYPNNKNCNVEVNGMIQKNIRIDEDIVEDAVNITMKRKEINLGIDENQSNLQKKVTQIEKCQQDVNKKINEIAKQLDIIQSSSRDSIQKMDEILSALGRKKSPTYGK